MNTTDYILEQLQNLISIDSPSGFTHKAAQYVMEELTRLGYQPQQTAKGVSSAPWAARRGRAFS